MKCSNPNCDKSVPKGQIKYCSHSCMRTIALQKMRLWREQHKKNASVELELDIPCQSSNNAKVTNSNRKMFREELVCNRNPTGSVYVTTITKIVDSGADLDTDIDYVRPAIKRLFPDVD